MLGIDKLFDYYCSANNITPSEVNKMIVSLLLIVISLQVITAIINVIIQFILKDKDRKNNLSSITYLSTREVYEQIYNYCKTASRNIIVSNNNAVNTDINNIIEYIADKEIQLSNKMKQLSDELVDKLHLFNQTRSRENHLELTKTFKKFKSEYKNHDNY